MVMKFALNSYNIDILKNYLFSFLNLFLRISLNLIAIPILSDTPVILAIYSICISFGIFFRYTDFGFITSGKKYAAEHVISNDLDLQLKLLGNSFSISFLISLILSVLIFIISFSPEIIISDLKQNNQYNYIASILLITLSISSLIQIFSNYVSSLFEINLKKYYCDIISIATALVSLLIFFIIDKTNEHWILTYYISIKILDFIFLVCIIFLTNQKFKITLIQLLINFRIKKNLIRKALKLSLTSIISFFFGFIFYELDNLFLAQNIDLVSVSMYSIAALGPFVIKTVFSLLYSPFSAIFNYLKNEKKLYKEYFNKIIVFFFPITFIGIITIVLFSEKLIFSYVGSNYNESIWPFVYLSLAWCFSFIIYPTGIYLFSMEFNKRIILSSFAPPFLFWTLNLYSLQIYGNISIEVFCFNKMCSNIVILPLYIYYLVKDNFIDIKLMNKLFKSILFSSFIVLIFYFPYDYFLNDEKNILGLIINIFFIGALIILIKLIDLKVNKNQIDIKKILLNTLQF
ncbi:MAG: hypothetical protein CMC04_07195 [Flavobacteriaceae bacterium]|nr:hypothetical protein [Flavobacteriaceae bacterium]